MKRAFLFGLTTQLTLTGIIFLLLGDQMLPMTRSPLVGLAALCIGIACGFIAWRSPPHPSWPVTIGLWVVGFLALFAAIPVIEFVVVVVIAVVWN